MINYYPNTYSISRICHTSSVPEWIEKFTPKMLLIGDIFSNAERGRLPFVPVSIGMSKQEVLSIMGEPAYLGTSKFIYLNYDGWIKEIIFQDQRVSKIKVLSAMSGPRQRSSPLDTLARSILPEDVVSYLPNINIPGTMRWSLNGYQLT